MTLGIYLHFNGDCREAFEFYKSVFGGEFLAIQTYGEGPPEVMEKARHKDDVLHVALPIGDSVLMGSDAGEMRVKMGDNFAITCSPPTKEDADRKFAALSKDGSVIMPQADTFWGAYFGMLKDKFGVNWMVNYHAEAA